MNGYFTADELPTGNTMLIRKMSDGRELACIVRDDYIEHVVTFMSHLKMVCDLEEPWSYSPHA